MSSTELAATHRIFNHVDSLVNYYGHKTLDEAALFVSENRWIMFPVRGINSLREGATSPVPNVFVSMDGEDISDDGTGRVTGYVGMTYHNVEAMAHLWDIFKHRKTKGTVLMNTIHRLSDEWQVKAIHKINSDAPGSLPHYDIFRAQNPSVTTLDSIKSSLADSDIGLPQKGDICKISGNPILWAVTIFDIEKETDPSIFDRDVKEIFDIFLQLHLLR
jgi:hypothetical protein